MRSSRLKVIGQSAVYHCVTRVVGGAMLLDKQAKEVLRKQLWYMSAFCGVEILTYCVMTNHFHVLVRVPQKQELNRHCGYAEAVAGKPEARAGLRKVLEVPTEKTALDHYRKILFLLGSTTSRESQKAMDRDMVKKVVEQDGELPVAHVLRLRIRYFTDGMVLGSKAYVNEVFEAHRELFGKNRRTGARPLRGLKESGLTVIRDLRKGIFT